MPLEHLCNVLAQVFFIQELRLAFGQCWGLLFDRLQLRLQLALRKGVLGIALLAGEG